MIGWNETVSFPVLFTERLLLRAFTIEDIPAVFTIFNREDVNTWTETDTMWSMEEAEMRVKNRMSLFKDRLGIRWAITLRENPKDVIGSCGFFSVRRGTQTVETGYDLHPDYWNKGLITEALREMIWFNFGPGSPVPVHRIEALVMPANASKYGFHSCAGEALFRTRRTAARVWLLEGLLPGCMPVCLIEPRRPGNNRCVFEINMNWAW